MIYLELNVNIENPLLDKGCSQVFIHYRQTKDLKNEEDKFDGRAKTWHAWLY